jgi:hypothetical protein
MKHNHYLAIINESIILGPVMCFFKRDDPTSLILLLLTETQFPRTVAEATFVLILCLSSKT